MLKAVYPAVWGVLQTVTGPLSDRWGRKGLIVWGMWVQAAGLIITLQEVISGGGCWEQYCSGSAPRWSTQHCSLPSRTLHIRRGGRVPSASIASGAIWDMP